MADRWAAAAMMAGHPNNSRPDNLYNLPFFIQCGGKDSAYDRNKIAAQWGTMLDSLAKDNTGAYEHQTIIYSPVRIIRHARTMKLGGAYWTRC